MEISSVNSKFVDNNMNKPVQAEKENNKVSTEGYAKKETAPTDANLYKSMYGVKEAKSYEEQLADHRAKYELDVNDKAREIEANKHKTENTEEKQEKSYYEQYLEYSRKYQ